MELLYEVPSSVSAEEMERLKMRAHAFAAGRGGGWSRAAPLDQAIS